MKKLYWKIVLTEAIFLTLILGVTMWGMGKSHATYESRRQEDRLAAVQFMKVALKNDLPLEEPVAGFEKTASRMLKSEIKILKKGQPISFPVLDSIDFTQNGTPYTLYISNADTHKESRGIISFLTHEKYAGIMLALAAALGLLAIPLARIVTDPLARLGRDMRKFASGDLRHRAKVASKDEVGELAKDFNEMAGSIQNLVRTGKEMTAHVSHELRSPLTRMDVASQVLEEQEAGKPNPMLDCIREEIKGMDKLIDKILRLSRLDLNTSKPGDLCFVKLLNEIFKKHKASFAAKEIRLQKELPDSLTGKGVSEDIACVADNLLSNMLKFTPKGGLARISLSKHGKQVLITAYNNSKKPDIDPKRLMEPFQRGGASESVPGSGLGLAIIRKIVENHGGRMSVSWSDGEFAVRISLPQ